MQRLPMRAPIQQEGTGLSAARPALFPADTTQGVRHMAQKVDFIFVNAIDLADPAIVQAARLLEREGVVKVIPVGAGQERPTTSQLLIVKKEFMERAATYRALELLLENQPNV